MIGPRSYAAFLLISMYDTSFSPFLGLSLGVEADRDPTETRGHFLL